MIVNLSELKTYLGIESVAEQEVLKQCLRYGEAFVSGYIGKALEEATFTEYFDGGNPSVLLKNTPISSITSVQENAGTQENPDWETVDGDEYFSDLTAGVIRHETAFTKGIGNVKVVYVGGYTQSTLPSDLGMVIVEIASMIYKRRRSQGIKSESISGGGSIDWAENLLTYQKNILSRYRSLRV
jgi:hypothetical protein